MATLKKLAHLLFLRELQNCIGKKLLHPSICVKLMKRLWQDKPNSKAPSNNSSNSNEDYMHHMTGGGAMQTPTGAVERNTTQHKCSHAQDYSNTPVTI